MEGLLPKIWLRSPKILLKLNGFPCDIIPLGFVDVADDALNFVVEKLLVSLIELGDSDAFLLADVELSLERVIFCLGYGCIERGGVVVR